MPSNSAPKSLPLLDLAVLAHLERQLNDARPARAFARDYIAGFEHRYLRLENSIGNRDIPAALDAALSLRNSSAMIGAARLSALAAGFEASVTASDLDAARRALPAIERCGLDTILELEARYLAAG
ncbi:Hpt domain-containing protein [Arthrobacter agilis]|uniref:Hpt domain-containing protein n=1 Tax=Arthrobacter agilis TaxID=37921 RepID=UPI002789711B|nr:Hpt domain-containing protein [Arthrobacter agilis]MDQ0735770.1 HPt (histidine-containing phosphotransfer) domain-containing protein [Arthrobacter agilis]